MTSEIVLVSIGKFIFPQNKTLSGDENLDMAMRVALSGPSVESFPYIEALTHWKNEKKRRFSSKTDIVR